MRAILLYLASTIALLGFIPTVVESVDMPASGVRRQGAGVRAGLHDTLAKAPPAVSFVALGLQAPPANVGHHVAINGPTDVPIGGLCIVIVEGLKADDSLSWVAVPEIQIADLIDRQGRPVLLVPSNITGTYHLVLAFSDNGKVAQKTHTVRVGQSTPVPPGPTPPTPVPPGPGPPTPVPPAPTIKAQAVGFFYEKDQHAIPAAVMAGLNRLNREHKIIATVFEADVADGTGEVPAQYKVPLAAARKAGLPALVVTAGNIVLRVVKDPQTEAQVVEAVK